MGKLYSQIQSFRDSQPCFMTHGDHTENLVAEEMLVVYGDRIPRNVWLKTPGKSAALDLYFPARGRK